MEKDYNITDLGASRLCYAMVEYSIIDYVRGGKAMKDTREGRKSPFTVSLKNYSDAKAFLESDYCSDVICEGCLEREWLFNMMDKVINADYETLVANADIKCIKHNYRDSDGYSKNTNYELLTPDSLFRAALNRLLDMVQCYVWPETVNNLGLSSVTLSF